VNVARSASPLRIIIGAGEQRYPGWIATQKDDLDLLKPESWEARYRPGTVDALLCEHVWEHVTEAEGRNAASLCFRFLKPGGYLRVAVPDGNFPDPEYQRGVQVGGPGPADHPAVDHKIVYDYQLLTDVFKGTGFEVDLLEYCDENGRFHYNQWNPADGPIYRSLLSDHRNRDGKIGFASLIVDVRKPQMEQMP
jgi:predicted SAM-dependent methyltransferase